MAKKVNDLFTKKLKEDYVPTPFKPNKNLKVDRGAFKEAERKHISDEEEEKKRHLAAREKMLLIEAREEALSTKKRKSTEVRELMIQRIVSVSSSTTEVSSLTHTR